MIMTNPEKGSNQSNHRRIDAVKLAVGFKAALVHINVTHGRESNDLA